MIKVIYNKTCGRCVQSEPLTSGMVGQTIELEYSADFDGLTLTAVFTNGKTSVDVLNPGNQCVIPHEVLDTVGTLVKVGIYAVRGNELVIPTIYANIGTVLKGADPSGDVSADPTLPVWAQIEAMIGNLNDLTTEAKNNLVAAINEAAQTGGGGGSASIVMRVNGGYIQYSTDNGKTWVNLIAEADLKGDKGDKGDPGTPGKDGAPGVYYGTTQPTGDTHPVWIDPNGDHDDGGLLPAVTASDNGKVLRVVSGAWGSVDMPDALPNPNALTFTGAVTGSYDGSAPLSVKIPSGGGTDMGITGATVGQIAKITAVDASGVPTAWSPVDMPSGGGGSAETFELIKYIKTTEAVNEIRINADDIGEPFELKEVQIYTQLYLQDDTSAPIAIRLHSSINGSTANYNWPFIAMSPNLKSNTSANYPAAYAGHFKPKDYTIDNKKYWVADTWDRPTLGIPSNAGAVNRIDFLKTGAYDTHVMDAVRCVMINAKDGTVQIGANSEIWIFGKRGTVT